MITVEDGTGLPEADSYISVADADRYHDRYGNASWSDLSVREKEIALRKATRDLDLLYTFKGEQKYPETQSLAFPRTPYNGLPKALPDACAELALVGLSVDVSGPSTNTGNIKSLEQEVGDLKTKTEYFNVSDGLEKAQMRKVNLILQNLLDNTSTGLIVRVERG